MGGIPKRPEDVFSEITHDLIRVFDKDLLSIILFGSGARGEYSPGRSDINFLVLLTEEGMERLHMCFDVIKKWKKRNVAVPLFMTKSFIQASIDSFPVEFLNIKMDHVTIFGEDVLKNLEVDKRALLLQLKRELKAKALNLWEEYVKSEGRSTELMEIIKRSMTAYISLLRALLYAKGKEVHQKKVEIIKASSAELGVDLNTFIKFAEMVDQKIKFSPRQLTDLFKDYIREARLLFEVVGNLNYEVSGG